MALADRLKTAQYKYKDNFVCKLMAITKDARLSKEDVSALLSIINSRPGDEDHVPNIRLAYALREEGFDVSPSAVDRHRNGICACTRVQGDSN
jgi:hypothetical protein